MTVMAIETKDIGMPGVMPAKNSLSKYVVKYYKANTDEPADMLKLSEIETMAIHSNPANADVVLMSTDKFTFMDKYFIVIKYLERV